MKMVQRALAAALLSAALSAQEPDPQTIVVLVKQLDLFYRAAGPTYNLTGKPAPGTPLLVYRNGLLQRTPGDYTLVGQVVTFTTVANPSPIVQVQYWKIMIWFSDDPQFQYAPLP